MDRRRFLLNGLLWTCGTLCGFHHATCRGAAASPSKQKQDLAKIAVIIDDIGYSAKSLIPFLSLGIPLTFSILPQLNSSRALAKRVDSNHHEVMLHQPMEPTSKRLDPGPGALYVGDNAQRISDVLEHNIHEVPFIHGVNNHMGSKFTACKREMRQAIKTIKKNGLFFIDSLTSGHSVGYQTARALNITTAYRNIFIDHIRRPSIVMSQLFRLKQHACRHGRAIGIGHPYPETVAAIKKFISTQGNHGVKWVPISGVLSA